MSDRFSLEQLVHLSLGDPEVGAVNFNVLKTLLLQMLKAMNLYNYKPLMSDDDQRTVKEALTISNVDQISEETSTENESKNKFQQKKRDRSSDRLNALEEKIFRFQSQLDALNEIPSNSELIDRAKQIPKKSSNVENSVHGPILEVWQYTQMEKRLESAENGITRLASLLQDLLSEINELKESNENLKQLKEQYEQLKAMIDKLNNEKENWVGKSELSDFNDKIEKLLSSLREQMSNLSKESSRSSSPDLTQFVTEDRLNELLKEIRELIDQQSTKLKSIQSDRSNFDSMKNEIPTSAKQQTTTATTELSSKDSQENLSEQIQQLNQQYERLKGLIEELEKKKLNRDEFDSFQREQKEIFKRLTSLEGNIDTKERNDRSDQTVIIKEIPNEISTRHSEDFSDYRTVLQKLTDEIDRLKNFIQDLIAKGNLATEEIDALKKLIEKLEQTKANKSDVNNELDKKADKRDLESRVLKKDFQHISGELSQNINDCMQKFHVHDDQQKKDLSKINADIEGKLNREELEALRDYMDKQLKKLKKLAKEQQQTQQQHVHLMSEDEAAGLRKQLIRFHCISCDRPIDVQPHPQQPSLPVNQGMRPIQSPRPYTTYELDQIRQYQKNQQFNNDFVSGGLNDVYATMRQCGGSHTMTLPFKRQLRPQQTIPEEILLPKSEVDIKGNDGVIYKGRLDVDKLPAVNLPKKNPNQPARSRTDAHPQYLNLREFSGNNEENDLPAISSPNLEIVPPHEESFT